jgi:hypothetical protein
MPVKKRMVTAVHPIKDTKGNVYRDYLEAPIVVTESGKYSSADGLFEFHRHSVVEKDLPHHFHGGDVKTYNREISVHHMKQASSQELVRTEFSVGPRLDDGFTKSLNKSLKEVSKDKRSLAVDKIREAILDTNPYLLIGPIHAVLVHTGARFGLTSTFEINRDKYALSDSYDDVLNEDSNGKVIGKNPYYISKLLGHPTPKRPHTIQVSVEEVIVEGKRLGVFAGLTIRGTWSEVVKAYTRAGLAKKIKEGSLQSSDLPDIITPFLRVHVLP